MQGHQIVGADEELDLKQMHVPDETQQRPVDDQKPVVAVAVERWQVDATTAGRDGLRVKPNWSCSNSAVSSSQAGKSAHRNPSGRLRQASKSIEVPISTPAGVM